MPIAIDETSKITGKGQTTIPKAVRQALGVDCGDTIAFRIDSHGVTIRRADMDEDPALDGFLSLLAGDLAEGHARAVPPALVRRILELTEGLRLDPDAEIDGPVAL